MRVVLTTAGSRGDVQPFVALAAGLLDAGHEAVLSTAARFAPLAAAHGVPFAPTTDALLDLMDEPLVRHGLETMTSAWASARQLPRLFRLAGAVQAELVDDSWEAVRGVAPDVVVFNQKAYWGPSFAEALGARAVFGALQPFFVPTGDRPIPGVPRLGLEAYNRLTYRATQLGLDASARRYLKGWSRRTGHTVATGPVPVVHGISPHVVPEPADWPERASMAGYWVLEEPAWEPPPELAAFLEAGPPPVYVGFGSMVGRDPAALARAVVEALRAAGVRGLLATGWGGLDPGPVGDDLLAIEGAPHGRLFPRCTAVVHHGGAGTTAAGLRAGLPSVLCPFFGDQPFWGRRVEALGVGPAPILAKELTAERLMAAVREATASRPMAERAEALGAALRVEDGVGAAVRFLERYAGGLEARA